MFPPIAGFKRVSSKKNCADFRVTGQIVKGPATKERGNIKT